MSRFSDMTRRVLRWGFGLWLAALGTYLLVAKIAVWPAIGLLAFGIFILRPDDLQAFAGWFKANAASYLGSPKP